MRQLMPTLGNHKTAFGPLWFFEQRVFKLEGRDIPKAMVDKAQDWLAVARQGLQTEAEAIAAVAARLDHSFARAVEILLGCKGKVLVAGVGKSGHVARKVAATLSSTGTPSVFLHAAEAAHGDLGIYGLGDSTLIISKSGTTGELIALASALRKLQSPLIGILGNPSSPLAREMDVALDASVRREADADGMIPTSSSIVAMALGDALAIALMRARNFGPDDFRRCHPGGMLGRSLAFTAKEVMHQGDAIAWVGPADSIKQVVVAMTRCPLGAACVVSSGRRLRGLITDGDLRRGLENHDDIRALEASQIMTPSPITIAPSALLHEALRLMEDRPSQISVLPVVDPVDQRCLGLVRLHDLYRADLV